MGHPFEHEAAIYDLAVQDTSGKITDLDRLISKAVYQHKQHLGPRGMIEAALAIAREIAAGGHGQGTRADG